MLWRNQHLDKLAAARTQFVKLGMLPPDRGPVPLPLLAQDKGNNNEGPVDELVMGDVQLAWTQGKLQILIRP